MIVVEASVVLLHLQVDYPNQFYVQFIYEYLMKQGDSQRAQQLQQLDDLADDLQEQVSSLHRLTDNSGQKTESREKKTKFQEMEKRTETTLTVVLPSSPVRGAKWQTRYTESKMRLLRMTGCTAGFLCVAEVAPGMACVCRYSQDLRYYRAEVISLHGSSVYGNPPKAGVLFVDYGSCEYVPTDE